MLLFKKKILYKFSNTAVKIVMLFEVTTSKDKLKKIKYLAKHLFSFYKYS